MERDLPESSHPPLPSSSPQATSSYSFHSSVSQSPHSLPDVSGGDGAPLRKRKGHLHQRKVACNVCHLAKTSCDGARPCSRCVRLSKTGLCVDRPSKVARVEGGLLMNGIPIFHVGMGVVKGVEAPVAQVAPASVVGGERKQQERGERGDVGGGERARRPSSEEKKREGAEAELSGEDFHSSDEAAVNSDASDEAEWDPSDSSSPRSSADELDVDEQLSRALLKSHLTWGEKQRRMDPACVGVRKMDVRDKLVYYTWLLSMMRPQHVEELLHSSQAMDKEDGRWEDKNRQLREMWGRVMKKHPTTQEESKDEREDRLEGGDSSGADDRMPTDSASSSSSKSPSPHQSGRGGGSGSRAWRPCDGRACDNFCPTAREWAATNPCSFTWHRSPEVALPDSAESTYAVLVVRDLSDARVCRMQNQTIIANIVRRDKALLSQQPTNASRQTSSPSTSPITGDSDDGSAESVAGEVKEPSSSMQVMWEDCVDCGLTAEDEQTFQEMKRQLPDTPTPSTTVPTTALMVSGPSVLSSTSASSSSLTSLTPQPIEIPMWCQVNSAFERLTGHSQAELRQHLLRDGVKSIYHLTRRDGWEKLMELEQEATWGKAHEYRTYAVVVNKYGGEVHCLLHTTYVFGNDGRFNETRTTFIPLPDTRPPGGRGEGKEGRERNDTRRKERRRGKEGKGSSGQDRARSTSKGRRKEQHSSCRKHSMK